MARPEVILHFLLVAVGSMCKVCNFADVLQISQGVHWGAPLLLPLFGGVQGGRAPPMEYPGPLGPGRVLCFRVLFVLHAYWRVLWRPVLQKHRTQPFERVVCFLPLVAHVFHLGTAWAL